MDESRPSSLSNVMPKKFLDNRYKRTKAYNFKDVTVTKEHCRLHDQDDYKKWPGSHKHIHFWVELENGYAVGWNENRRNGWSFPVIKMFDPNEEGKMLGDLLFGRD
jgi:hypothetical protein